MKDMATVDVTAIKKRYMGDILAAALVEGMDGLYAFDTQMPPDFKHPWRMLIHEMLDEHETPKAYQHVNIVDTQVYRECTRLVAVWAPRLKVTIAVSVAALVLSTLIFGIFKVDGPWVRAFTALTSCASVLSLIFIFFQPRSN